MSDDALRDRERRYQQSGETADAARWLTEAARAGRLEPDRLTLAAYLGHEAALSALGLTSAATVDAAPDTALRWLTGLDRDGRLALVAAAVGALRARFVDVPSPRAHLAQALSALEAYVDCPCDEHGAAALAMEPQLAGLREALVRDRSLEGAGFARRAQDAARAVGACLGLHLAADPFEPCLRDVRGAGPRAATLIEWVLAPRAAAGPEQTSTP